VGAALEREHREIDAGIEAFRTGAADRDSRIASLRRAMDALRRHIYLEEELLFPEMRATLAIPTLVMLREHGELWTTMRRLDATLAEGGDDASVLEVCRELVARLESHNAKEEPIFYTEADSLLAGSASAGLQAFLDSGRMPDGWVCERARP
jgi:hemerythrin-like domain-containing protein